MLVEVLKLTVRQLSWMYSKLCNSKFAPKIVSFAPISVVDVVVSGHKTYASMWTCVFPALTTANVNRSQDY